MVLDVLPAPEPDSRDGERDEEDFPSFRDVELHQMYSFSVCLNAVPTAGRTDCVRSE
jgi:hypothetical protein